MASKKESKSTPNQKSTSKETPTAPKKKKINSRTKGASNERVIAKKLSEWWGAEFHRVPASGGLRWGKDNRVSGDIVPPAEDAEVFPFSVECKKVEDWDFSHLLRDIGDIKKWWEQCTRDALVVEKIPLLIYTKNRSPIYFMIPLETWKKLPLEYTRYFETTVTNKGDLDYVVTGLFDDFLQIPKEEIIKLLS